ncbi:MAG: YbhB/YbcL family Raf kinase inhibitor-like protein [Flavisolibacter sp.]
MFNEVIDEVTWDEKKGIPNIEVKPLAFKENRDSPSTDVTRYQYLKLESEAFQAGGMIPSRYTCDGKNINPPISIGNFPDNAKSLAVIVDDPDAINGNFCHWVIWDLPITDLIEEGEHRGIPGRNDFGFYTYNGPCPPVGTHRYYFKVYALDMVLSLPSEAGKTELEKAMRNHVVGFGFLVGKYHMRI